MRRPTTTPPSLLPCLPSPPRSAAAASAAARNQAASPASLLFSMEPSPDSYEGAGGAGGKITRRRHARVGTSKPYDRPPTAAHRVGADADGSERSGWLSRIVNPATRFVASGASRLFASVFGARSLTPALPAPPPPQQGSATDLIIQSAQEHSDDPYNKVAHQGLGSQNGDGNGLPSTSGFGHLAMDRTSTRGESDYLTELPYARTLGPSVPEPSYYLEKNEDSGVDKWRTIFSNQSNSVLNVPNGGLESHSQNDDGQNLTMTFEQGHLGMQRISTKSEVDRSTELPHSRILESGGFERSVRIEKTEASCPAKGHDIISNYSNRGVASLNVASSPIGIAKAYMNSRSSRPSRGTHSPYLIEERRESIYSPYTVKSLHTPTTQKGISNATKNKFFENEQTTPMPRGGSEIYNLARFPHFKYERSRVGGYATPSSSGHMTHNYSPYSTKEALKRRSDFLYDEIGTVGPLRRTRQKPNMPYTFKNASSTVQGSSLMSRPHTFGSGVEENPAYMKSLPGTSKSSYGAELCDKRDVDDRVDGIPPAPFRSSKIAEQITEKLGIIIPASKDMSAKPTPSSISKRSAQNPDSNSAKETGSPVFLNEKGGDIVGIADPIHFDELVPQLKAKGKDVLNDDTNVLTSSQPEKASSPQDSKPEVRVSSKRPGFRMAVTEDWPDVEDGHDNSDHNTVGNAKSNITPQKVEKLPKPGELISGQEPPNFFGGQPKNKDLPGIISSNGPEGKAPSPEAGNGNSQFSFPPIPSTASLVETPRVPSSPFLSHAPGNRENESSSGTIFPQSVNSCKVGESFQAIQTKEKALTNSVPQPTSTVANIFSFGGSSSATGNGLFHSQPTKLGDVTDTAKPSAEKMQEKPVLDPTFTGTAFAPVSSSLPSFTPSSGTSAGFPLFPSDKSKEPEVQESTAGGFSFGVTGESAGATGFRTFSSDKPKQLDVISSTTGGFSFGASGGSTSLDKPKQLDVKSSITSGFSFGPTSKSTDDKSEQPNFKAPTASGISFDFTSGSAKGGLQTALSDKPEQTDLKMPAAFGTGSGSAEVANFQTIPSEKPKLSDVEASTAGGIPFGISTGSSEGYVKASTASGISFGIGTGSSEADFKTVPSDDPKKADVKASTTVASGFIFGATSWKPEGAVNTGISFPSVVSSSAVAGSTSSVDSAIFSTIASVQSVSAPSNTGSSSILQWTAPAKSTALSLPFVFGAPAASSTTPGGVSETRPQQTETAAAQLSPISTVQFGAPPSSPFGVAGSSAPAFGNSLISSTSAFPNPFSSSSGFSFTSASTSSSALSPSAGTLPVSSSSAASTATVFGSIAGSSPSPSTFVFGQQSSSGTAFAFGMSSAPLPFSFTPASTAANSSSVQTVFGFGSGSPATDQMNEDGMADDTNHVTAPAPIFGQPAFSTPVFGQPALSPATPVFGAPAVPPGGSPLFQFGAHQGVVPQNPSPFQSPGNVDFQGGSFSLGAGGGTDNKNQRRIVRVKKTQRKK